MERVPTTPPAQTPQMNFPFMAEPAFAPSAAEAEKTSKRHYRARRFFRWSRDSRELVSANLKASGSELSELIDKLETQSGNPRDACLRFARQLGVKTGRKYG